jgi:hypothetical protein
MAKMVSFTHKGNSRKKRPGVHAKTKTSRSKNATNYKKAYRGQGKQ